ncbi:MAG TPA: site-specific integrase [Bacteroidales bacterium]|nr:site-specific integrase [Bacteroidales bacterium]
MNTEPIEKKKVRKINTVLDNFSLNKVTAAIFFDTRRVKENLLYPVKYRVTFARQRIYYPSGIDLSEEEWVKLLTTKGKELIRQRELIQAGFEKVKQHIIELFKSDQGFTLAQLNIRLSSGVKNSIISAFNNRTELLKQDGRIGTSDWYLYSVKSIQRFVQRDMKFNEITKDWLKKYEAHLLEEGKSYTSISMYMRALQAIMNEGKRQGVISQAQYPFGKDKYEIPEESGRKMALTLTQIGEVLRFPLLSDTEKKCRDLWFFSYLTNGINMSDLLHLKYSNIVNGNIRFYRQKTVAKSRKKKEIVAVLLPEMKQIIERWGNPYKKADNFIFPFLKDGMTPVEEQRIIKNTTNLINKKMRKIGKALGYGNISTYTARHSFATVLKRSGANIAFISESLGHADLHTTESYLDSFEDETRLKNAAELTKF